MHRALLAAAVLLALAASPAQAAVEDVRQDLVLMPDTRPSMRIEGSTGDSLQLDWSSDVAIDVFVVQGENSTVLDANGTMPLVQALNRTEGRVHATLPNDGPWILVLDNRAGPAGGAPGNATATVEVSVAPYLLEVPRPTEPTPSAGPDSDEEAPTLWNTLLFDSWKWVPGDAVAFGGVALWALLVLVVTVALFGSAPLRPTVVLAGGVTAFVALWSLPSRWPGAMTEIGLCAVAGLLVAWLVVRQVGPTLDVLRVILVATIVGAFAGDVLGWALKHLWTDPGILYFGNRRFVDEIFTVPGFGVAGFLLFKVIPVLAHAQDVDEEHASHSRGPMQPDVFQVRCLRCQTDIKVDRSMKRFRVATDRFEFACPNCQYWMEWADPNAKGSAAA